MEIVSETKRDRPSLILFSIRRELVSKIIISLVGGRRSRNNIRFKLVFLFILKAAKRPRTRFLQRYTNPSISSLKILIDHPFSTKSSKRCEPSSQDWTQESIIRESRSNV